jgi:hypothetical protein
VIIIDNVSDEFVDKYKTDNISFYLPDNVNQTKILLHDVRFMYFKEYIEKDTETDFFVLTDIGDVVILNPIEKIIELDQDIIYLGMESEKLNDNKWFDVKYYFNNENLENNNNIKKQIHSQINDYNEVFKDNIIINCGTICGHRTILLKLLDKMIDVMNTIYSRSDQNIIIEYPTDMFAINYVAYKYFDKNIYKENKLTTIFFANEYDMTKCIKHK